MMRDESGTVVFAPDLVYAAGVVDARRHYGRNVFESRPNVTRNRLILSLA